MRLPRDPAITPTRVGALLATRFPGVHVEDVEVLGESEGSANRLLLRLEVSGSDERVPQTMFLKRNLATFTFPPAMYLTECRFYRDLAPGLEIETPEVYGLEIDESTGAFMLLMEDLHARNVRLGIATEPTSPDDVASVLETLARLHARFWESPRLDQELTWLELPTKSPFVSFWQKAGPKLARRHVERGHRAAVIEGRSWAHDRVWEAFGALQSRISDGPRTVLHGDVHVGNTYFVPGSRGGVLDWQLMLQGSWSVDVAYLVMTALDPQTRAASERELLGGYLRALSALGVDAPREADAWDLYRENAIWGVVMWLVTPEGVHTDEVQATSLERCLTATEDLEGLEALGV
jgi:aminoglycoside phosphotransferase (APT) family kinase protein